ncbi:MAG: hypothetical protein QOG64_17, partial [Acidimicrobiaceae bacterium]|nr:hypothetical protein [Acidimicrobiaceae bacterium]
FGVVFAAVRHRLATRTDGRRSLFLAAAGFVAVSLVPFVKYPANPPSVGDPDTITRRTLLYLVILAWSVIGTWAAWRLARWLRDERQLPEERWVPLAAIAFAVIIGAGLAGLPGSPDKVAAPATLIWRFRLAVAGGSAVFWATLGLAFGLVAAPRTLPLKRRSVGE